MARELNEPARCATVETDPLREIDDRLDRWAYWRRGANRVRLGGNGCSPLARLQAEGAEVDNGGARAKRALSDLLRVRVSLRRRYGHHMRIASQLPDNAERAYHVDQTRRLKSLLSKVPKNASAMAWASLIAGSGMKRERDYPEEEETQAAVVALPPHLRDAIEENWINPLPQDMKAREMGITDRTLRTRINQAKWMLKHTLARAGDLRSHG